MTPTNPSSRIGPTFLIALPVMVGLAWGGTGWGPSSGNPDPALGAVPEVASVATTSEGVSSHRTP
ncbi:MAG: hypothetical protein R3223_03995, partial [Longimicrobiales bacterium]|nr:hypothetical protein [Longimicrobiales bacterium]